MKNELSTFAVISLAFAGSAETSTKSHEQTRNQIRFRDVSCVFVDRIAIHFQVAPKPRR